MVSEPPLIRLHKDADAAAAAANETEGWMIQIEGLPAHAMASVCKKCQVSHHTTWACTELIEEK